MLSHKTIRNNRCIHLNDIMDDNLQNIIAENYDDICGFHQVELVKKKFLHCILKRKIRYRKTNIISLAIDDEKEQDHTIYYIDDYCLHEYDDSDAENDVISDPDSSESDNEPIAPVIPTISEPVKGKKKKPAKPKKEKIDLDYNVFRDYKFSFYLFCRDKKKPDNEDDDIVPEKCIVYGLLKSKKRKELYFVKLMDIKMTDNKIISDLINVNNIRLELNKE